MAGEHAVVYGKPALVAAVNRRLTVSISERKDNKIKIFSREPSEQVKEAIKRFEEVYVICNDRRIQCTYGLGGFEIKVDSEIPVKVGMGSSAAVAVATVGALLALLGGLKKFSFQDKEMINKIAYETEKRVHTHPSGVDNTISTFGGFLWFKKGKPLKRVKLENTPHFVFINTGRAEETTGEMVKQVNSKLKTQNSKLEESFNQIEKATKKLLLALKGKDKREIMKAIKRCEDRLEEIGVVGEFAKRLVREIENSGGVAKICGAGGIKRGSGVLLCYHPEPLVIFSIAKRLDLNAFAVNLGEEGVRVE